MPYRTGLVLLAISKPEQARAETQPTGHDIPSESGPLEPHSHPTHPTQPTFYDSMWKRWLDMNRYGPASRHIRRLIMHLADQVGFNSIADVGCGIGSLISELRIKYPNVLLQGFDISNTAIEIATEREQHAGFLFLDIEKEPSLLAYDLVICSEVLEHIYEDKMAVKHLCAMCRKSLIITVPGGRMRPHESRLGHYRNYSVEHLTGYITANGFAVQRLIQWGFPFYSPIYRDLMESKLGTLSTGKFGTSQKLACWIIYQIFRLNSHTKGDQLAILASR
jgi:SAM-dependent methyltransferase